MNRPAHKTEGVNRTQTVRSYPFVFTGERRLKLTGESNRLDVNADFMTTGTLLNTPTLYPSAYLVLTNKGYTKHYYAGADRVAASLGGGGLKATGSNPGMQDRAKWLFWESHERVNGRMLQKNDLECIWQGSLPTGEYCKPIDGIPGRMNASVEFYLNDLYDNLKMLAEEQHDEKDVYFYHSDHLGSASWITDADGKPIQHLQYLPFGEPFVNQHLTDYQERYLFTGKERDEETGYGYFGARYMDHELTAMWLSVDPMADKYPSISPYAYCAWNPIKLVDPDGKEIVIKDGQKSYYYINGHVYTNNKGRGPIWDSRLGQEAKKIKGNLDIMSKDKAGAKVINRLVGNKKQTYTIAADASSGDGSYNHISNKVSLVSGKANNLGSLSHELFHAYQDDKGRTPHTIYNELEAYVFSGVIYGASLGITSTTDLNYNEKGVNFAKDLKCGKPFNENTFQYLLNNFKNCSAANWKGAYTSYSTNPGNYKASESLLKDLFQ